MIKFYHFPTAFDVPNLSPFAMKLEAFLKLTGLPYQSIEFGNPAQAPKGKAPYIDDQGKIIGDSALIINYLKETYQVSIGEPLIFEQQAISTAMQAMIEEHLYWCVVYSRWIEDNNWAIIKELYFSSLPPIMRNLIANQARKTAYKNLHAHGMGRHTPQEIYAFARTDIQAMSDYLGQKEFFFGKEISELDLVVYSMVTNLIVEQFHGPFKTMTAEYPNLLAHKQRVFEKIELASTNLRVAA